MRKNMDMYRDEIMGGVFFVLVAYLVINLAALFMTGMFAASPPYELGDAKSIAAHEGFVSGKAYPAELGSRVNGSVGEGHFYGGFLSGTSGNLSVQPGSSISVKYKADGTAYIFEIPTNKVKFREMPAGSASTVNLYIDGLYDVNSTNTVAHGCGFKFYGVVTYTCDSFTLEPSSAIMRGGLSKVVSDHLTGATISLPSDTYQKLAGTP